MNGMTFQCNVARRTFSTRYALWRCKRILSTNLATCRSSEHKSSPWNAPLWSIITYFYCYLFIHISDNSHEQQYLSYLRIYIFCHSVVNHSFPSHLDLPSVPLRMKIYLPLREEFCQYRVTPSITSPQQAGVEGREYYFERGGSSLSLLLASRLYVNNSLILEISFERNEARLPFSVVYLKRQQKEKESEI